MAAAPVSERLRKVAPLAAIALVVAGAFFFLVKEVSQLGIPERFMADYRLTLSAPARAQHGGIAIVGITEETIARFPYRSPIDRGFLADLLVQLEAKGARGIAVDILFDQPTEEEKDDRLKEVIANLRIPFVASYANVDDTFMTEDQTDYINEFLPVDKRAFAWMRLDFDGTARWIYAGRPMPEGPKVGGLGAALAAKLGYPELQSDTELDYWIMSSDEKPFPEYEAHMLPFVQPEWIKDKVVFVGGTLSLTDRYRTPMAAALGNEGIIPGVTIHAHSFAQIMDGRRAPTPGPAGSAAVFMIMAALGVTLAAVNLRVWVRLLLAGLVIVVFWAVGFALYALGTGPVPLIAPGTVLIPLVYPTLSFAAALWLTDVYTGRQERQQKRFIQQAFSRYLSPALLDEITRDPKKLSLEAQRREMSFIFTDVAGFTSFSEKIDAAHLAQLLNRYLDGVCRIVFRHGGTVDKFIGDAVFAIFNAPRDQPDHAARAVACAIEIDQFSEGFREAEEAAGGMFGITRIGVHTGIANVGNFGSDERFEYTALGDAVNTAARLEGLNKYLGTRVCISEAAAWGAQGVHLRPCGAIVLKGKSEAIQVFEPLTPERADSDFILRYRLAYDSMSENEPDALAAFEGLAEENPYDGPTRLHLERLREGQRGIQVVMTDK